MLKLATNHVKLKLASTYINPSIIENLYYIYYMILSHRPEIIAMFIMTSSISTNAVTLAYRIAYCGIF